MKFGVGIYILGVILFSGCKHSNKMDREVNLLLSRKVEIPEYREEFFYPDRNVYEGFEEAKLKYVVYADSLSCSPCFVKHLNQWMKYIYDFKKYGDRLKFYFILSPKIGEREFLAQEISNSSFDYPVFLDVDRKFGKYNSHIPDNQQFHYFLLDENNHVILIGSPLTSQKIEVLFYKVIKEKLE